MNLQKNIKILLVEEEKGTKALMMMFKKVQQT